MMEETKKFEKEREALFSNPKNGYDRISEADLAAMESYCKEYMKFISDCKMERGGRQVDDRGRRRSAGFRN